jgi:hypothetical protein
VFENKVLRRIFGPKMEEEVGGWKRLHHEELHKLYSSPNIIRAIKSSRLIWGACSTHGSDEKCISYLGWKTEGKRPLRRPRCRWEDNINQN